MPLALSSSKVARSGSADGPTKSSRYLRNQEILVASLNHETRSDDAETFCATSQHSLVTLRHHAGTTLSYVRYQPNSGVFSTYLRPWKHFNPSNYCIILNIKNISHQYSLPDPACLCPEIESVNSSTLARDWLFVCHNRKSISENSTCWRGREAVPICTRRKTERATDRDTTTTRKFLLWSVSRLVSNLKQRDKKSKRLTFSPSCSLVLRNIWHCSHSSRLINYSDPCNHSAVISLCDTPHT